MFVLTLKIPFELTSVHNSMTDLFCLFVCSPKKYLDIKILAFRPEYPHRDCTSKRDEEKSSLVSFILEIINSNLGCGQVWDSVYCSLTKHEKTAKSAMIAINAILGMCFAKKRAWRSRV